MNIDQFKSNVGARVQLVPVACRLDEYDNQLPEVDDLWLVETAREQGVRISNTRTGHGITLGWDHIHHYTSNPDASLSGIKHGFLTLHVQVFLRSDRCWLSPNLRPGEPVLPKPKPIFERYVDFQYPYRTGLLQRVEARAYEVKWCLESRLAQKVGAEGWKVVVDADTDGALARFRVKDLPADQVLIARAR